MPVFDKPITVGELIEQLGKYDPGAMVVVSSTNFGPDGIQGIFAGYVQANPAHINMRWICDPANGYVPAVELKRSKPGR